MQIVMKHAHLITDTAYKMPNEASFLESMYRHDIWRNVSNQNTDLRGDNFMLLAHRP